MVSPPDSSSAPLVRLARSGTLNVAGTLAGGVAGILLVITVTNTFSPRDAGLLFAATSLFLILTAVAELGAGAGLAHTMQRALAAGDGASARACLPVALLPILALSVLMAAGLVLGAPTVAGHIGTEADTATSVALLRVLAAALPVATAYSTVLAATRALGTMRPNVLVEKLGRLPAQIVGVLPVAFFGAPPVWLAVAWSAPYALGLVAVVAWYRRLRPDTPAGSRPPGGTAALAKRFWSYTAPRALAQVCQVALQRVDIILIAALLSPAHASIYLAATRFLIVGQLGTQAIQQVLQPQLARLFADSDGNRAVIHSVFTTATAWLMALAWPTYIVSALTAPLWLQVFGPGYGGGQSVVLVLALTMLVATACGPVDTVLLMAGRSVASLANNAAALIVNLALNVALIPAFGLLGAALAWSAALLVRNFLPAIQVRGAYGLVAVSPATVRVALSAALAFATVPLPLRLVLGEPGAWTVGWMLPGTALYGALVWHGRDALELGAFGALLRRRSASAPVMQGGTTR